MNWRARLHSLLPLGRAFPRRQPAALSQQIARLRWQVPLLALLLVSLRVAVKPLWLPDTSPIDLALDFILFGLAGPAVVWLALGWTRHRVALKEAAEAELVEAHAEQKRLNRRISFLLNANRRFSEATDEESLSDLLLQLPAEVTPAVVGSALIRFDDHRQSMPVIFHGAVDEAALTAWHHYLSSAAVRARCAACRTRAIWGEQRWQCPLFARVPRVESGGAICLPLERNGREFATLSLMLGNDRVPDDEERHLLAAMISEATIAFENCRLRSRELTAFYEINETLQLRLDLDGLMARILAQTVEASGAEAGMLLLQAEDGSPRVAARAGHWAAAGALTPAGFQHLVATALAAPSAEPTVTQQPGVEPTAACVLCAPLMGDAGPLGTIVLGSTRPDAFRQHLRLVSAIAAQAALLAHNARLYARLEHQAILAERGRLAREMHDGLAQTLGYIKMRVGQIGRWLEGGQAERVRVALADLTETADEAYLDLRTALDGLRLSVEAQGARLADQLRRLAADFEAQTGLPVTLGVEADPALSAPAQSHLLRIAQEALANVRRHSGARHVTLGLVTHGDRTRLLVEDDGRGFDMSADQPATRHGLRLMRERADLLGADVKVMSTPGHGTRVWVEWPVGGG